MQVHYDEGVATHIDPEPCVQAREGLGEASVGARIGQPLSRERKFSPGCRRRVEGGRPHGGQPMSACARPIRRGRRPWHVQTLLVREPGDLTVGQQPRCSVLSWSASGRQGAEADDVWA